MARPTMLACCKLYISESRNAAALRAIEQAACGGGAVVVNRFTDDAYNRVMCLLSASPIIHGGMASLLLAAATPAAAAMPTPRKRDEVPGAPREARTAASSASATRGSCGSQPVSDMRRRSPTLHMCFRRNMELVVELYSGSGWLCLDDGGGGARCRRCNGRIRVVVAAAVNGRSVVVRVVDECDYVNGCCNEDGFAPPCQDNVGGESLTVWKKLGSKRTGANRMRDLVLSP
ncbi:hypothetical protein OsJ_25535 [Oryza sativa Japonica Group]|uniref:Formiminotransferase N-terminal subdomain domain-containing protein n=1 Tax=Oryza sativa subsp. japonica TaxID=39947 RepID=A3BNA9_ORYSJ|nr:hypothetical protein OsJ_25535 [Oryza sativa Japonica Group]